MHGCYGRGCSIGVVDVVQVDLRKWPDTPHWNYTAHVLGDDSHGRWLHVPSWTTARRASEKPRQVTSGFVTVVPESQWWTANFYLDHPWLSVYVNICTPCEWSRNGLRAVDLDLDVIRDINGNIEIIDEDDFATHQRTLAYPADLIAQTRAATDTAMQLVTDGAEPFGVAAEPWLNQARKRESVHPVIDNASCE